MTTEELVNELRRPLYSFTMTQRDSEFQTESMRKSVKTRRANAELQIHELVMKYARERL